MAGPSSGKECVFPFILHGITHNACTKHGIEESDYAPWCSTMVDDDGVHIDQKGLWGDCSPDCPIEWGKHGLPQKSSQDQETDPKEATEDGKNIFLNQ